MTAFMPFVALALFITFGGWLGWQLLRQNGRMLLRLDEMEKRLDELQLAGFEERDSGNSKMQDIQDSNSEVDQSLLVPHRRAATGNADDRGGRFGNRLLARSRIKRDGLKAGTLAPDFRLPRVDGRGELSLQELRGQQVLLVFSDPHCGPCQALAPHLEKFHRAALPFPPTAVVMISRGAPKENRAKVQEHGLTFPVLLQQQWEISRLYAMFATPMAYLIDERSVILNDVAMGVEPILKLMAETKESTRRDASSALALDRQAEMC